MKKIKYVVFLISILLLLGVINVIALSIKNDISFCKKECNLDKKDYSETCKFNFKECINNCPKKDKECKNECNFEKIGCNAEKNFKFSSCAKNCNYIYNNLSCGNHPLGEVFYENCSICKCEVDNRINCKKTDFCNYKEILRNKTKCTSNNGFYQQLCNGPYFDIVCSKDNYCLCDGDNSYSCPPDYICLHEFNLSLTRRGYTISGWKTLLGKDLGNIGVCVKN